VSSAPDLTNRILRHERVLVAVSITVLATLCWWYVASAAVAAPSAMAPMREPPVGALVIMWWLMMVAMMLPSAAPAILLYSRIRETRNETAAIAQTWVFLSGYLAVWLLFSIVAAFAQRLATGPSMALHSNVAEGALLIAAGVYQLSPVKSACIRQCRSPAQFLTQHWRPGMHGAVRLGISHGAYCLGCCWMLMTLLFVGGIMNVLWIAGLTLLVAAEKLLSRGDLLRLASAIALLLWGFGRLWLSA
jgi:predicted metal-binding membrane protein